MSFVGKQRDEKKTESGGRGRRPKRERETDRREKEKSIGDPGNLWVCPGVCTGDIAAAAHRRDQ